MTLRARFTRLLRDRRGVAVTEFAILAPVLMVTLMGLMDLSFQAYTRAVLEGAIQKAGRDSGIEGATATEIDAKVTAAVKQVANRASVTFDRRSYSTFGNIKAERFTDTNGNGIRDPNECYDDVNGNGMWDADPGKTGQGGANDVTLYTVTATYPRMFPLGALLGWSSTETISAKTLLKNQPYATQAIPTVVTRCS
ncbi:TadE/TadG family type IV pilus assembly protein [Sphingomonas sp.]|uniref:TadE/TadG family type IV pilus assembly protein n=1 Tax=Sphingomonas sp. TaxID=28214 RepID=UPI0025F76364|nr:TadE/TadG family type IV pilus assembly protein [Sphingomonas sp.]